MPHLITEQGFEAALDAAQAELHKLDPALASAGQEALKVLRNRKGMVVGHAEDAIKQVFSLVISNEVDQAELVYLRSQASIDELIDGMDQDTIGVIKQKAREEKAKAEFRALLWDMTMTGIKIALPLILAAL